LDARNDSSFFGSMALAMTAAASSYRFMGGVYENSLRLQEADR
jgi:hypothetical protein